MFKQINIPDLSVGDLKITGIMVQVSNDNPNNVHIGFDQPRNGLDVSVDNTNIKVHVNWRYEISFIKISGTGDISGPVRNVHMTIGFETQPKGNFMIPKINVQNYDIDFDKGGFDFKFDWGGCPGDVISFILNALRGPLLDKVRDESRGIVSSQVANVVNNFFQMGYPVSVAVNDYFSIATSTVGALNVKSDYLSVPIDATVFLTKEGYNRQGDGELFPSEDPTNPGEIQLFVGQYTFRWLENSINKIPVHYETSIYGLGIQVDIDGSKYPLKFSTKDGNLHVEFGSKISIPSISLFIDIVGGADFTFAFKNGDSTNMIYVDPDVNRQTLQLSTLKLSLFGWNFDLSAAGPWIVWIVEQFIDRIILPVIPIPKQSALPLTATAAVLKFFDTHAMGGIAFNFGFESFIKSVLGF